MTQATQTIRIVVLGTGDFALPMFEHLCDVGHEILALITQPDLLRGRKQELIPSPIKRSAQARGVRVLQPENVTMPRALNTFPPLLLQTCWSRRPMARSFRPTCWRSRAWAASICTGRSCLPTVGRHRVVRAIENGETETGVTVIRMTPKIDAGGMIAFARTPIAPDETAGELESRLAALGAPLIARSIVEVAAGTAQMQTPG